MDDVDVDDNRVGSVVGGGSDGGGGSGDGAEQEMSEDDTSSAVVGVPLDCDWAKIPPMDSIHESSFDIVVATLSSKDA